VRKTALVYPLVFCLIFASCTQSQATPSPTAQPHLAIPLPTASPFPKQFSPTTTSTNTPQPTNTETHLPFSPVISPDNVSQLVEVGRIGKGTIRQVAWSPSGNYLALATSIGVYVYTVEPLVEVNFIPAPAGVNAVTYGAGDDILVAAFDKPDNTIRVFDPLSGELLTTLGNQPAQLLSFSLAVNVLVAGYDNGTVSLWELSTGAFAHSWHPGIYLEELIITPNGDQVITGRSGYATAVLEFWDASTGMLQRSISYAVVGVPRHLASSPDNSNLATASWAEIVIRNIPEGDYLYGGDPDGDIEDLVYSSDGQSLIIGMTTGTIQVWNATTGALARTLNAHTSRVTSLAPQPGGVLFASAGEDGLLQIWDTSDWHPVDAIDGFRQYQGLRLSPDGSMLAARDLQSIYLWAMDGYDSIQVFTIPYRFLTDPVFSPDSRYLAVGSCGITGWDCPYGAIFIWDLQTMQQVNTLYGHSGFILQLVFIPHSQWLISTGPGENTIRIWDFISGEVVQTIEEERVVHRIALPPAGDLLAVSVFEEIHLWDLQAGQMVQVIASDFSFDIRCFGYSPDGQTLVGCQDQGKITGYDHSSGARVFLLRYPFIRDPISLLDPGAEDYSYSLQSSLLVIGYGFGPVAFFDMDTERLVGDLKSGRSKKYVELTPDGWFLLTNDFDEGVIRIWGLTP